MTVPALRIGIIGCGQIARDVHIPTLRGLGDVELVAFVDPWVEPAAQCVELNGGAGQSFRSVQDMLDVVAVDAVTVCAPNKYHADIVTTCLRAGCHVLCEKPPAVTSAEVQTMADIAQSAQRILTFGFHLRHSSSAQILKAAVDEGALGVLQSAKATAMRRDGFPSWRAAARSLDLQGGGPLMDMGVHVLDLILWFIDYPHASSALAATHSSTVTDSGRSSPDDVEEFAHGFVTLENGCSMLFETSFDPFIDEEEAVGLTLTGSTGRARLFPLKVLQAWGGGNVLSSGPAAEVDDSATTCYERQFREFVDCCRSECAPTSGPSQAIELQSVIERLYASAASARGAGPDTVTSPQPRQSHDWEPV